MAKAGMVVGGRYRLERPLGAGAMGEVWAARDTVVGRAVAVKLLSLPAAGREVQRRLERFLRECGITAKLSHPGHPGRLRLRDVRADRAAVPGDAAD